jgi:transposase
MLPQPTRYLAPDERDCEIFGATVRENHYLRHVKAVIDFERVRDELASCYCAALGRPAQEPILLLKLEFLQFHYGLSDRRVVEQAHCNMAFRYFLDLSLHSPLPHPTSLTYFRNRLGVAKHQAVFESIVAQARECGLVKDRLRLKDATHVLANIAIPSTIRLLSQTRKRLLKAAQPFATERVAAEEIQAEVVRTSSADLSGEERLYQRVEHLRTLVAWVEGFVDAWGPAPPEEEAERQTLRHALALAHRVLADREKAKRKRKGKSKKDKKDALVSLEDEDARWGKHGKSFAGYLLDMTVDADSSIVTAVNVLPANGDEPTDAIVLVQQEEEAHGNRVEALSIDGVGFRGPLLRELTNPEGLNLEVIVPPIREPEPAYFTAKDFTLDADTGTLTCPSGQTTSQRQRTPNDTSWTFTFSRTKCQGCPLQDKCMKRPPQKRGRAVVTNDYQAEYDAIRAKAQTPEFQKKRRQQWRVERKLGEIVRWHGGRFARYRGRCKVLIQEFMTAMAVNVKRMVRWTLAQKVRAEVTGST